MYVIGMSRMSSNFQPKIAKLLFIIIFNFLS